MSETSATRRPTVPELEAMLYQPIPVLDHGWLICLDYMGDDKAITDAARVSYGRGTRKVNDDRGLIRYLMRMNHSSPFEQAEIKFHLKLPIFVMRQLVRHRMANLNEVSGRYSVLDNEFYLPSPDMLAPQSTDNRQGRAGKLALSEASYVLHLLHNDAMLCHRHYRDLLNEDDNGEQIDPNRQGLARELARINLTLNTYTQIYWKIDLHNLMHFLRLRTDPHAQYEIRVYADVLLSVLEKWVPLTAEAFREYRLGAVQLSATGLSVVRRMLAGETVTQETSGLSKREWRELMDAVCPN